MYTYSKVSTYNQNNFLCVKIFIMIQQMLLKLIPTYIQIRNYVYIYLSNTNKFESSLAPSCEWTDHTQLITYTISLQSSIIHIDFTLPPQIFTIHWFIRFLNNIGLITRRIRFAIEFCASGQLENTSMPVLVEEFAASAFNGKFGFDVIE